MKIFSFEDRQARWPIAATLVAVIGFLGINLFSFRQSRAIDAHADSIAGNAAPSMQLLSSAKSEVGRMQIATSLAIDAASRGLPVDRAAFDALDHKLHVELAAYLSLPTYPNERDLYLDVDQSIDHFQRSIDRCLQSLAIGDVPRARIIAKDEVYSLGELARQALEHLIDFNAAHLSDLIFQTVHLRRHVELISLIMHLMTGLLAVALMFLSVRAIRSYTRLNEERHHQSEIRAAELEQFAGRVAHDMKGPLSAIALRLELLQSRSPNDQFEKVFRQIRSMTNLVDGLLDFARAGAQPAPDVRTDLALLIDEVADDLRSEANRVGAVLHVNPMPRLQVACSEGALYSVLSNLLRNAVKYIVNGQQRDRRITVCAQQRGDRYIRVEIEDTGPGIPHEKFQAVFEPFVRLESNQQGIGLGLATVKRVIEAHHGNVGVISDLGRGSCFWFELPIASQKVLHHASIPPQMELH